MATIPRDSETTRRTRAHQIADLSVNHVEKILLEAGHVPLGIPKDYGYDVVVTTHNAQGFAESGQFYLQLKASKHLKLSAGGSGFPFSIQRKHYNLWRREPSPVFLVRYCARTETAYYLYLQPYFDAHPLLFRQSAKSATILIPRANILDAQAVKYMHGRKRLILAKLQGTVVHVA